MGKSVYSLVLNDAVVAAVDAAAYAAGTNRSALVNRVLAEYVSYVTPEQRVSDIFSDLCGLLEESGFRLSSPPSGTKLSVGSALSYKYNPRVRYCVELTHRGSAAEGKLKVSLRTTNASLISVLELFYGIWKKTEAGFGVRAACTVENGRYERNLNLNSISSGAGISSAINAYITAFDTAMKGFLEGASVSASAVAEAVRAEYARYLSSGTPII